MRPFVVAAFLLLPLLAPTTMGQAGPVATLDLEVQPDHSEKGTLTFDGLKALTRYEGICLPERARETRVYDELGDVEHTAKDENGRRAVTFLARSSTVKIDLTRTAAAAVDHPLYPGDVNFCVPASASVVVRVTVPSDHTIFFVSDGTITGKTGTTRADGPTHVFYSYEAPVGSAPVSVIDAAPFRVFVSNALATEAADVARTAAEPYRAALAEAGVEMPFDSMRVLFAPTTPFAWEAGHYNGHGYVQVKEDTLSGDRTDGYPLSAARVLVHEAFHGATFPYGKGAVEDDVAWWLEGSAKHSERQVDAAMPNATRYCEKNAAEVRCWDFDDRIKRDDLDLGYSSGFTFDADWEPSKPQSDETRHFYYGYSEYLVGAWIARHSVEDYQRVWDQILAAFGDGTGCPCTKGWLEGILDDEQLFTPWEDVRESDPTTFETFVKPFVKDEEALQRELKKQANPFSSIPSPAWLVLVAIGLAVLAARKR